MDEGSLDQSSDCTTATTSSTTTRRDLETPHDEGARERGREEGREGLLGWDVC